MTQDGKLPISLVVITANEEQNLARCVDAANFCSETIIVDSGSTDRTLEIARGRGAKVMEHSWQGYHAQKQFACEQATQPWILCIDADEVVSPELRQSIETEFRNEPDADAFDLNRHAYYGDQLINHSGWYPQWRTFLFRQGKAHWAGRDPHPIVQFTGTTRRRLTGDLYHYTCRDTKQHVLKNVNLAQAGAKALFAAGKTPSILDITIRPMWATFRAYILQLGFLDGLNGFLISATTGYCTYLKYAMLRELHRQGTQSERSHA